jgi:prepilin-type N-terminal cleavage/methylation domain-containing protein
MKAITKEWREEDGFSLVELAVVLIVIGVIIAGVLKGQDMIASARLNGIQTQINQIRVAVNTFQNKYNGLPGDIDPSDEILIPGFAVATNTNDGTSVRGNGIIEGVRLSGPDGSGSTVSEATLFWQHLRATNLLSGIVADPTQGALTPDEAMKSPLGGVFTITYDGSFNNLPGQWLELGSADTSGTTNNGGILSPVQLHSLDVKSDDGLPDTGTIGGRDATGVSSGSCSNGLSTTSPYQTSSQSTCAAYFQL